MKFFLSKVAWILVAALGAWGYAVLAFRQGEHISSAYLLLAALCSYAIGYRFYSKFIAVKVLMLEERRATPCEVHDDGKDFVKTNKWIVFGHHFAAISGPGPLVGPVLAAQFGYLPGALWILIGVVLGGAVQDFVVLFCSMRRNGRSLAQMVKEELNSLAGAIGLAAILAIMIILLAVLALVVVKALAGSPWGVFTVGATIPIAMLMGGYLRFGRIGKVAEASVLGVVLLLLAVWGGQFVHSHSSWSQAFTLDAKTLAWLILAYGLAASVLPVWLLLAPRDYLSTFMKLGTIFVLVVGVFVVLPKLQMPAITKFVDGSGLVVAGTLFPFCFITIACGAISGFHTLICSGTTPKIIARESHARAIGYGAMCLESLVAIMALIAACTLDPGVYLGMNIPGGGASPAEVAASSVAKVEAAGFKLSTAQMDKLAAEVGEKTLFDRAGGAATLAVGMTQIFTQLFQGRWSALWYHFAIMFEALFILTTLDAGTRVGRYLLQDMLGNFSKTLGDTKKLSSNILASCLVVGGWGYFLIQGVLDPLGGINSLWPLFGIANQLLASIALCLTTTVILKMQLQRQNSGGHGRPAYALVTFLPLLWLLAVTATASIQKIYHPDPRIGFLAQGSVLRAARPALEKALTDAKATTVSATILKAEKALTRNQRLRFNAQLNAIVAGVFLILVAAIVVLSLLEWGLLLARRRRVTLRETVPVWLPDYALAEGKSFRLFGLLGLCLALLRELSGEAQLARAERTARLCACTSDQGKVMIDLLGTRSETPRQRRQRLYAQTAEARYSKPNRCC